MELRYSKNALDEFEGYLQRYEDVFCDLYSDTGLRDELKIIQEHRDRAAHLKVEIMRAMHDYAAAQTVLGRKKRGKFSELCFYVGRRLVVVLYTDEPRDNVRWIESILFDHKRNK